MVVGMGRHGLYSQETLGTFQTARMSDFSMVLDSSQERIVNAIHSSNLDFIASNSFKSDVSRSPKANTPGITHNRNLSNPFEVLYEPVTQRSNLSPSPMNSKYLEIERAITSGTNLAASHPIIYPFSNLSRNGSIISTESMIRKRHNIRKRTKVVRRTDLPLSQSAVILNRSNSPKPKQKGRVRYMFPVKRQSSLKRKSSYTKLDSKLSDFSSQKDIDDFFLQNDISIVLKELLPKKVQFYSYANLWYPNPTLNVATKNVQIADDGSIIIREAHSLAISAPLKDTFVKTSGNPNDPTAKLVPLPLIGPGRKDIPSANQSKFAQSTAYEKYRHQIYNHRFLIPPRFEDLYPEDVINNVVSPGQVDEINRQLLLEILLRRTVAAKIEFRLKKSGKWTKKKKRSTDHRDTTSSSYSELPSSSSDNTNNDSSDSLPRLESSSDHSDDESINTDDLMQQNASLFSELLPSPQISYASDIFGSEFEAPEVDDEHPDPVVSYNAPLVSKPSKQSLNASSRLKNSDNPPTPSGRNTRRIHWVSDSPFENKSDELLYINDFYKRYFAQNKNQLNDVEKTLFNSDVYQLKPMNRSFATLSSTIDNMSRFQTPTPGFGIELSKETRSGSSNSKDKSLGRGDTESSHDRMTSSVEGVRTQSTTNTSVFKVLEDLASELSSFANEGKTPSLSHSPDHVANPTSIALQNYTFPGPLAIVSAHGSLPLVSEPLAPPETVPGIFDTVRKHSGSDSLEIGPKVPKQTTEVISSTQADVESIKGSLHATDSVSSSHTVPTADPQQLTSLLNPIEESSSNIREFRLGHSSSTKVLTRAESYRVGSITANNSKFGSESSVVSQENSKFILIKNRHDRDKDHQ